MPLTAGPVLLKLGCCQILSFRELADHPQFLASTRHVSMDAVSVRNQEWKHGTLSLSLQGVAGATETYWFHCPTGYSFLMADVRGGQVGVKIKRPVVAVCITFDQPAVELQMRWKKQ